MGLFSGAKDAVANATIKMNYDGKDAESGLNRLKDTFKTVIGAAVIKQMLDYTVGLAKLGAQSKTVAANFENFATARGKLTSDMMNDMRKATLGTISNMDLQQRAMQAMVGGVNFDDMVVAMEYVTKFAQATGQDVNDKMQSTMTGLARKSAQFLDDIGIQVMGSKDVVSSAIQQMKEKMGQFVTSEEDAMTQSEALNAQWKNTQAQIGNDLIPAFQGLITFLSASAKAIGVFSKAWVTEWDVIARATVGKQGLGGAIESIKIENLVNIAKEKQDASILFDERAKYITKEQEFSEKVMSIRKRQIANKKILDDLAAERAKDPRGRLDASGYATEADQKRIRKDLEKDAEEANKQLYKVQQISGILKNGLNDIVRKSGKPTGSDSTSKYSKEQIDEMEKLHQEALKLTHEGRLKILKEQKDANLALYGEDKKAKSDILALYNSQVKEENDNYNKDAEEKKKSRIERLKQFNSEYLQASHEGRVALIEQERDDNLKLYGVDKESIDLINSLYNSRQDEEFKKEIDARQQQADELAQIDEELALSRVELAKSEVEKKIDLFEHYVDTFKMLSNGMQALSDAQTQKELNGLDKKKMSERQYEKERQKILAEAEEKNRAFARVQQGIILASTIARTAEAVVAALAENAPIYKWIDAAAVAAAGALQIATIEAQHFSGGGLVGGSFSSMGPDDTIINARRGEFVVNPSATAQNYDLLQSINNNTANTARGMRSAGGGMVVNNFYGQPVEHMLQAQKSIQRRQLSRREI